MTSVALIVSVFLVGFAGGWCGMTLWISRGGPPGGHRVKARRLRLTAAIPK